MIRVMVLQINDYMVSYESVRRRFIETKIITQYSEFQKDATDKQTYEAYYNVLYEEMRLTLEAMNSPKQVEKEEIAKNEVYY